MADETRTRVVLIAVGGIVFWVVALLAWSQLSGWSLATLDNLVNLGALEDLAIETGGRVGAGVGGLVGLAIFASLVLAVPVSIVTAVVVGVYALIRVVKRRRSPVENRGSGAPWRLRNRSRLATLGGLLLLVAAAFIYGKVNAWATCGAARIGAEGHFLRPDWMPSDVRTVAAARERAGQEAYERCYKESWWVRDRD